jgi:hypothetical protein
MDGGADPSLQAMAKHLLECLRCGTTRELVVTDPRVNTGECPRCHYVGWASSSELDEPMRRVLRERPPESRRLRAVA